MATEVRHRRGTSAQLAAATPAQSEIIHNVETNTLHVGDGVTLGGHPLAKAGDVARVSAANFDARTSVLSFNIPASVSHIRTAGYSAPGDGGGALYKRVAAEPAHVGKVQSADGAWWEMAEPIPNARMFGAKGDGTTDDTVAVKDLFNLTLGELTSGQYKVTSTIPVNSYASFKISGVLVAGSSSLTVMSMVDTVRTSIDGLKIVGTGKADGTGVGLLLGSPKQCKISNFDIRNISGKAIAMQGGTEIVPATRGDKNIISGGVLQDNWYGWYDNPNISGQFLNEYNTITGLLITGNQFGVWTSAGNNSFIGCKVVDNYDGFLAEPGVNSTHGIVSGCQFNHNSNDNIKIVGQSSGLVFSGCTVYGDNAASGVVRVYNSRGIVFSGGQFEASIYCDGAASNVMLQGCYNNGNFIPSFSGTHPQNIYIKNCLSVGGAWQYNDVGMDFVAAFRSGGLQALTVNTPTVLVFGNIFPGGNKRGNYNATTGKYTCPTTGKYRVSANIKLTGTTVAYVSVRVNGGERTYTGLQDVVGFRCGFVSVDLPIDAGSVIDVVAVANGTPSLAVDPGSSLTIELLD